MGAGTSAQESLRDLNLADTGVGAANPVPEDDPSTTSPNATAVDSPATDGSPIKYLDFKQLLLGTSNIALIVEDLPECFKDAHKLFADFIAQHGLSDAEAIDILPVLATVSLPLVQSLKDKDATVADLTSKLSELTESLSSIAQTAHGAIGEGANDQGKGRETTTKKKTSTATGKVAAPADAKTADSRKRKKSSTSVDGEEETSDESKEKKERAPYRFGRKHHLSLLTSPKIKTGPDRLRWICGIDPCIVSGHNYGELSRHYLKVHNIDPAKYPRKHVPEDVGPRFPVLVLDWKKDKGLHCSRHATSAGDFYRYRAMQDAGELEDEDGSNDYESDVGDDDEAGGNSVAVDDDEAMGDIDAAAETQA